MCQPIKTQPDVNAAKNLMEAAFRDFKERTFNIRFWDDSELKWCDYPSFVLSLNSPDSVYNLFHASDLKVLGEAFIEKRIDVDGNLIEAIRAAYELIEQSQSIAKRLAIGKSLAVSALQSGPLAALKLIRKGRRESRARVRSSVNKHYDLPLDFWRSWLDSQLQYTCAYYQSDDDSIDQAQANKIEHICRKLRLAPGERFVEFGCGWAAFSCTRFPTTESTE